MFVLPFNEFQKNIRRVKKSARFLKPSFGLKNYFISKQYVRIFKVTFYITKRPNRMNFFYLEIDSF